MSGRGARLRAEQGSSSVASVIGVAIFLGFLLLATQVLIHLYATSTVTAVAFDEARRASGDAGTCAQAETRARSKLGSWGQRSDVSVSCVSVGGGTSTRVIIAGPSPARGLALLGGMGIPDRIERAATVRTEHRPDGAS